MTISEFATRSADLIEHGQPEGKAFHDAGFNGMTRLERGAVQHALRRYRAVGGGKAGLARWLRALASATEWWR